MRALDRIRRIEIGTLTKQADYDVEYFYDAKGRVEQEVVTGSMARSTAYGYDEETDNIITETVTEGGVVMIKTYQYDATTGDIKKILIRKQ